MRGKVSRWGNSLAIRIPKSLADEVGMHADDALEIRIHESRIILEPVVRRGRGRYKLDELLDQVAEGNLDEEVDWGPRVGDEEW